MEQQAIIDAILGATSGVFSTMLGLEVQPGPVRNVQTCPSVQDGVMSFAGISGPWVGTGIVTCSVSVACQLSAALLMSEMPTMNEEVLDCVGEITNMIIGNFKTDAERVLGPLTLSVPTVIYGRNFISRSLGGNDWLVMAFHFGEEMFEVHVCLRPAAETSTVRHSAHVLAV